MCWWLGIEPDYLNRSQPLIYTEWQKCAITVVMVGLSLCMQSWSILTTNKQQAGLFKQWFDMCFWRSVGQPALSGTWVSFSLHNSRQLYSVTETQCYRTANTVSSFWIFLFYFSWSHSTLVSVSFPHDNFVGISTYHIRTSTLDRLWPFPFSWRP
jgi:hypothetical protein